MRKMFVLLCGIFMALCHISCEESLDMMENSASQERDTPSPKVERLIQQAREGRPEAYEALAMCYRDGDGVRQSDFNMLVMYMLFCEKSGGKVHVEDFIEQLDANHRLRLLTKVLDHKPLSAVPQETIANLRRVSPADALLYEGACAYECEEDTLAAEHFFAEAVARGSEIGRILQVALYKKLKNHEKYEHYLHKYAAKFPLFYALLGDMSMKDESPGYLQRAVEYYLQADKQGMLPREGARRLAAAYRLLEQEGKMKCDEKEMARLNALITY